MIEVLLGACVGAVIGASVVGYTWLQMEIKKTRALLETLEVREKLAAVAGKTPYSLQPYQKYADGYGTGYTNSDANSTGYIGYARTN